MSGTTGCYTQFATLDNEPTIGAAGDSAAVGDDSANVVVVKQADTVVTTERQYCYWTRNWLGEPQLRCDRSYYPRDWYIYNEYPWWYRSSSYGYYDAYGRCPRYSYFDNECGQCRRYEGWDRPTDRYYYNNDHSSSGSSPQSTPAPAIGRNTHPAENRSSRSSGLVHPVTPAPQPALEKKNPEPPANRENIIHSVNDAPAAPTSEKPSTETQTQPAQTNMPSSNTNNQDTARTISLPPQRRGSLRTR